MILTIPSFLADYLPQERKQLYKNKEQKAKDNSFAFLLAEEEHKLEKREREWGD